MVEGEEEDGHLERGERQLGRGGGPCVGKEGYKGREENRCEEEERLQGRGGGPGPQGEEKGDRDAQREVLRV